MPKSVWGVIRNGKIEPAEKVELPDGSMVLVTVFVDEEQQFWQSASEPSLASVWDNTEDDVYAQLLQE